jgi:hypothetical protein
VERVDFVQAPYADTDQHRRVAVIADELRDFLMIEEIATQIVSATE